MAGFLSTELLISPLELDGGPGCLETLSDAMPIQGCDLSLTSTPSPGSPCCSSGEALNGSLAGLLALDKWVFRERPVEQRQEHSALVPLFSSRSDQFSRAVEKAHSVKWLLCKHWEFNLLISATRKPLQWWTVATVSSHKLKYTKKFSVPRMKIINSCSKDWRGQRRGSSERKECLLHAVLPTTTLHGAGAETADSSCSHMGNQTTGGHVIYND
uniref:uncharacterized protein LOC123454767 isoform X2 n=1 Tax=Jaculus jaculus TaxID=51337 RepID=UPI001E1B11B3|nr:uncharacterized protein LOC123454767 isoform X2 [Jaculus jaculus]